MLGEQETVKLLKDILQRSSADQTEVILLSKDEQLTRFADNEIHQNVSEANSTVMVRVADDTRVGMGTTNDLTKAGLDRVVETAMDIVRLQPDNPEFSGFPEPHPISRVKAFDDGTAAYSPEDRARQVGVICQQADAADLTASGAFSTSINELAVANSHGVLAYHAGTTADLVTVVMGRDSAAMRLIARGG